MIFNNWHKYCKTNFQRICLLCHENTNNQAFCSACFNDLQKLRTPEDVCPLCADPSSGKQICSRCMKQAGYLSALWAGFQYTTPITHLVQRWKYQRHIQLSASLQALLLSNPPTWFKAQHFDAVVAVPLSQQRLFKRGFNQSEELANAVAKKYKIPMLSVVINRQHRQAQMELSRSERLENLHNIFSIPQVLENQRILIIDDVSTTGTTLNELAKSLIEAGAEAVCAWVLLHGQNNF